MEDWTRDEDVYDLSYSEMVIETEGVVNAILVRVVLFIALHYKHGFAMFLCDNQPVINSVYFVLFFVILEDMKLFVACIMYVIVSEVICCIAFFRHLLL
jgi:hypothetical protein